MKLTYAIFLGSAICAPAITSADEVKDCIGDTCTVSPTGKQYEYKILDMPMDALFSMLQGETGQRIVVAPGVRGRVSQIDLSGSAEEMIAAVAQQNDLEWFSYDEAFYVSRSTEATTRLIPLEGLTSEVARQSLDESGLLSPTARINSVADGNALSISGPPEYVALAEAILKVTGAPSEEASEQSVVRVRRGMNTSLEYYGEAGMIAANQTQSSETASAQAQSTETNSSTEEEHQQDRETTDG
ncbi:hypothetical protein [Yoonia sp. 2307UL14-13]|uniref:hypothetical protein n=1 Tax=Yoonia sp. 2307UL14-13 TaxID=3126506 RepID=UPI0030ABFBDD